MSQAWSAMDSVQYSESKPCIVSRLIWLGALLLVVYSVWVWAGLRPSFHRFAFYGSLPLAALLLLGGPAAARRAVWRDVVFWLGLLFNVYLLLQWSNAGRELVLDATLNQWVYTDPPRPGWPYAFDRDEAWQMITWFFPAWILVSALRSPHVGRRAAWRFVLVLIGSAGLLALFGLIQEQSGTREVYGLVPFRAGFFASFIYRNHATSFFGLMACVAAGVFFHRLFERSDSVGWRLLVVPGLSMVLGLFGLIFCGSRAAVFFAVALAILFIGYGFIRYWLRSSWVKRLHAGALLLVLLLVAGALLSVMAKDVVLREFRPVPVRRVTGEYDPPGRVHLTLNLDLRALMARTGWRVWQSEPWLGVGGWGYKYAAAFHVPEDQWWVIRRHGFANVHVDALQFLAEFGVIGFSLLAGLVGVLIVGAFRVGRWSALWLFSFVGLGLVGVHSMIDIPFRSPGVMYHWLVVLALLPILLGGRRGRPSRGAAESSARGHAL